MAHGGENIKIIRQRIQILTEELVIQFKSSRANFKIYSTWPLQLSKKNY
jgi:hypothetical protein